MRDCKRMDLEGEGFPRGRKRGFEKIELQREGNLEEKPIKLCHLIRSV